ncbi:carbon-nitrogen hydrolase family protein [Colwellia psychrerythraea]|uniref:Nitrilase/cyanide hydratase and apolipoprotein N-acyltransferase n=1 Tax=Colwellia psychrerythraea TaxID=28229 RepID=A0A099KQ48_COLPS|nr:carbon-nitrogen hydrolase family protein [Colwellia psychrerythraea]KGJ92350.1 Nitrilase/cyanide hydratase and apolipoprotein N-acyltransferase [Colwellia psychrerythraea]
MVKLTAIQLSSAASVETNLAKIAELLTKITEDKIAATTKKPQHLVVLPECCLYFGGKDSEQLSLAKKSAKTNALCQALANLAKKFKVYLVAGTIPILTPSGEKFTNSSCIFNPNGELIGQYDKIHLFDVNVNDSTNSYCESHYTQAGENIAVVNTAFANIGLSVCFDLRFPNLFQQLTTLGAEIITVPSAFTKVTGKAHWQTLLQARAIENQVYIIAAGQEGVHENGRETWGHSMIINPWGEIEKSIEIGEGYISVDYQKQAVTRIRQSMPLHSPLSN